MEKPESIGEMAAGNLFKCFIKEFVLCKCGRTRELAFGKIDCTVEFRYNGQSWGHIKVASIKRWLF